MSNSNLVDVVIKSPNCDSPRKDTIQGITIHHMGAVLTAEECGKSFQILQGKLRQTMGLIVMAKLVFM